MLSRAGLATTSLCGCGVVMLTACGALSANSGTNPFPHRSRLAVAATLQAGVLEPVTLPVGYSSPTAILGDPKGARVWFWAQSQADIAAFQFDLATRTTTSYHLADPIADHVDLGIDAPLVEDSIGDIWFGTGSTLIELDPGSRAVTVVNVPAQPGALGVTGPPPQAASFHPIIGLSADASGHIALAMMGAASVPVFDSASHTFASMAIPSSAGEVTGVAYLTDGTLGIATRMPGSLGGTVELVRGAAATSVDASASFLTADGASFLTGDDTMLRINESGATTTVAGLPVSDERVGIDAVAPLPDGRIALPGRSGVIIVNPTTGSSVQALLPREPCAGASLPHVPGQPAPSDNPDATCQPGARAVASDSLGDIWLVSSGSTRAFWLLPAGQF